MEKNRRSRSDSTHDKQNHRPSIVPMEGWLLLRFAPLGYKTIKSQHNTYKLAEKYIFNQKRVRPTII
jgi:hypothetical protein